LLLRPRLFTGLLLLRFVLLGAAADPTAGCALLDLRLLLFCVCATFLQQPTKLNVVTDPANK
jgi:hypothetical protein